MLVIRAYALAYAVTTLLPRLSRPKFERIADQALHADGPINIVPRLRKITLVDELASGLLCGPIFVFVGRSNPLLHVTIFAASLLVLGLILWWLICRVTAKERLLAGVTVSEEGLGLGLGFLRFALALFVSAKVALWLAT